MKIFKELQHEKRTDPVMDTTLHCTNSLYAPTLCFFAIRRSMESPIYAVLQSTLFTAGFQKKKVLYFSHFPLHTKCLVNLKFFDFIILENVL